MAYRVAPIAAGLVGVIAALLLPFAPVTAQQATVTWPAAGKPTASTTAFFVPYRPQELTATIPVVALRPPADGAAVTVLATGPVDDGLVIEASHSGARVRVGDRVVSLPRSVIDGPGYLTLRADSGGVTVSGPTGLIDTLADARVPRVFGFRTALAPQDAARMSVTAKTTSVFATSPTNLKRLLVAAQLLSVAAAVVLLMRTRDPDAATAHRGSPAGEGSRAGRAAVDTGVVGTLAIWAVVGPLAVDDGWATLIARTYAASGNPGNYYRWWNASETPFAFWEQMISPLTSISVAPVWLRGVSTLIAIAAWLVTSRGVLGAALPALTASARWRAVAALCFLAAWMPFNLGVRPEGMVALGVVSVVALLWRARGLGAVAGAVLIAAATVGLSPTAIVVVAPFLVFAPRIFELLRAGASHPGDLVLRVLLLAAIAAACSTVVFFDQTWDGFVTATDWHRFFGPSFPWYREPDRYRNLLGADQMGSFAKRLPVLLSVALVPIAGLLMIRRRDGIAAAAGRLGAVLVVALLLMALTPSKWSYHLGALAAVFAAFLTVAVALLLGRTDAAGGRRGVLIGLAGGCLVACAAALSFAGPNAWWLPVLYRVPWAMTGPRPFGIPLRSVIFWGLLLLTAYALSAVARRARRAGRAGRDSRVFTVGPAGLVLAGVLGSIVIMLGSFVSAPLRYPTGSLAVANWRWLLGKPSCGFADSVDVLADEEILTAAERTASSTGFTAGSGFAPQAPPPDPPGSGMSTYLWGSRNANPGPASLTTAWFTLPSLGAADGLSTSVVGKADSSRIAFEFGRAGRSPNAEVVSLGQVTTTDPAPPDLNAQLGVWRAVTVDAAQIPAGADRVRLRVEGAGGRTDWVAVTGPRRNSRVPLSEFLSGLGPVLLSWPQSFVFPCVHDVARVADGVAQTPRVVMVDAGPWFTEPQDQRLAGVFAGLQPYGQLYEVPTRFRGHSGPQWGALLLSAAPSPDAYDLRLDQVRRPGHGDRQTLYQVDVPP